MYHWRYRLSDPNLFSYYPSYIISEDTNDIFDDDDKIPTSSHSQIRTWPSSRPEESSSQRNDHIRSQNKHKAVERK